MKAAMVVIFSFPERQPEASIMSIGTVIRTKGAPPKKLFGFSRPFTGVDGSRLTLQVIQTNWNGGQRLIGYGYCDLILDTGTSSRVIDISLWRPKGPCDHGDKVCGTFHSLADPRLASLPREIDRRTFETVSALGKIKVHIQKSGYF